MKVFKFGGASVKDAQAIENLKNILLRYQNQQIVVVISAMGKTTNFLEKILKSYRESLPDLQNLVAELRKLHENTAVCLMGNENPAMAHIDEIFCKLEENLSRPNSDNFDYDYDRIVSFGELLSTTLISDYLNSQNVENQWFDARQLVRTDNTYREGHVDWEVSEKQISTAVSEFFDNGGKIALTQGFIAGTAENQTTTLGREGSDFSAAIFAYALGAESVTVWKDVPGILNADPKRFQDAVKIDKLSYYETVELAYYGASVIHPKTLKPLHLKNIPLYVKSFFEPDAEGSIITNLTKTEEIPSFIVKNNQVVLSVSPRDFSIIGVDNLSEILSILSKYRVKINMIQNSALTFSVCTDNRPEYIEPCIAELSEKFSVKYNSNIELITIRHYKSDSEAKVLKGREIMLRQSSRHTIQIAVFE